MDVVFEFFNNDDLFYFLVIPFFSGFVGLVTNYIGIKMMFAPIEFVGIKPIFGWQGIVPARAGKFARLQMEQVEKIIDFQELIQRIDPSEVANIIRPGMKELTEEIIDEVASDSFPLAWENTPNFIKNRFYKRLERDLPSLFDNIYNDVRDNFDSMFDAKAMVIDRLTSDKAILVDMTHKTVHKELGFLVKSGLYFGFLFGIVQMVFWYLFPEAWYVLPVGGFVVGYLTNWIAVKLMFHPLNPKKIGPFTLHGLFLKRKDEVARDYAKSMTTSVLNTQNIAEYILKGSAGDKIYDLVNRHIKKAIDNSMGYGKPLVLATIGTQRYIDMKNSAVDRFSNNSISMPKSITNGLVYTEQALDLENEIELQMKKFTPLEFDGFVRPVFEEDEWILYAVGGGLGFLAGWAQFVTMFS
ncbi:hypothetical protein A9Q81_13800 [Gammaproteobacteria bacterium 42_54_T18]|nr:hypothetical protein A9Q81_13800 [Gammaproteobacteria bacterium 42_54_T18]